LVFTTSSPRAQQWATDLTPVTYQQIDAIVQNRCQRCHSTHPTDDVFKTPPKDLVLETEEQVRKHAQLIHLFAVVTKTMPQGNKTGMTEDERETLDRWLRQQNLVPGSD
jgi:uncharacterized membrane protein